MLKNNSSVHWEPEASIESIKARARMYQFIRAYFFKRNVLEVETPLMASSPVTAAYIASIFTDYLSPILQQPMALQTSPEYAMKRLLAAGSGDIFQICKAFRHEPPGRFHNPEFSILEWYRIDWSFVDYIAEVYDLIYSIHCEFGNFALPNQPVFYTYQELFIQYLSCDPLTCEITELAEIAKMRGVEISHLDLERKDDWLSLLLTHVIEPQIKQMPAVVVHQYPVSQAALAIADENDQRVAKRFEIYSYGVELANGFCELTDVDAQRQRFMQDNLERVALGLPQMPIDEFFLAALRAGMPACCGVAVGLDRLLMIALQQIALGAVITFPVNRA